MGLCIEREGRARKERVSFNFFDFNYFCLVERGENVFGWREEKRGKKFGGGGGGGNFWLNGGNNWYRAQFFFLRTT